LPGELIECQVTQVKRRFAFARSLRIIEPSDRRIEPRCPHFPICGGCKWQDLPYSDQIEFKRRFVADGLQRISKLENVAAEATVPAVEEYFYRNKMEYSFGRDDERETAGLHVAGRYDAIFELEECFLQSESSVQALHLVRRLARELGIQFYDDQSKEGELRFLVVREGKMTGELMLNVVTFTRDFAGRDELFSRLIAMMPDVTSLIHTINGKKANVAIGDEVICVHGRDHITEKIGELIFKITPFGFFQTNTKQSKALYDMIAEHAELSGSEQLLDLFCGCGSIGMYLAGRVESVYGIDINTESIAMANANAELNGITNTEFAAGDVRRLLVEIKEQGRRFDLVVTDPPRAGLEAKAVRRIARLDAERLVCVSCNPATLARDLALFAELGYKTIRVTPVDMFPQTAHVEAVATLVKS
jgi:23S rRNA (uracil1939-C5)-methyltransferase